MRLISLSGKAGSGKDTVARMINSFQYDKREFKVLSWADPLKEVCSVITGVPLPLWYDRDFKETYSSRLGCTGRKFMTMTSEGLRSNNPEVFTRATVNKLKPGESYIIPDTRLLKEIAEIHFLGGFSIRINRPGLQTGTHATETELDDYKKFDFVIDNSKGLDHLYRETEEAYKCFCNWLYYKHPKFHQ